MKVKKKWGGGHTFSCDAWYSHTPFARNDGGKDPFGRASETGWGVTKQGRTFYAPPRVRVLLCGRGDPLSPLAHACPCLWESKPEGPPSKEEWRATREKRKVHQPGSIGQVRQKPISSKQQSQNKNRTIIVTVTNENINSSLSFENSSNVK